MEYDESDDGKYGVCVHCGSRNLGLKVFSYWNNIAKSMTVSKEEMRLLTDEVKTNIEKQEKLNESINMQINELASLDKIREIADKNGLSYKNNNITSID